jgi:spore maturation protein B
MQDMPLFKTAVDQVSMLAIPALFFFIVGYALLRRVKVYEEFIEGGKEGFGIFLKILPYLVAILVAIGMFRESGALDAIGRGLAPLTAKIGMPAEALPVALMRPLSGSGSLGLVSEIVQKEPDSLTAKMASTMFGSADTTLYIVALYFGSVGLRKIRHALVVGLCVDLAGILAAVWVCRAVFG